MGALRRCLCGGVLDDELRCPSCGEMARTWVAECNGRPVGVGAGQGRGYPGLVVIAPRLERELRSIAKGPPLSERMTYALPLPRVPQVAEPEAE